MRGTRVTIEDVARDAGVSIATVSRFINGRSGAMSTETSARIRSVIERLGYEPSSAAQTLKTGRSRLIGVVLTEVAHVYWSSMLAGIEESARQFGYGVVISSAGNSAEAQNRYVSMFLKQKIDGLLLNPAGVDQRTLQRWNGLPVPVVMLDRTFPGLDLPLIAVDNAFGARLAVEHLLGLGHRRIAIVGWEALNLSNRQERLQGYRDALTDAGIALEPRYERACAETWEDGVLETLSLFEATDPPTAVFSANAELSLQVLAALKQLGLRVPADVSVVGFDDSPWDPLLDPPLTTVATPPFRLGKLAAKLLCEAIDRNVRLPRTDQRLKPHLVVRASTASPRSG